MELNTSDPLSKSREKGFKKEQMKVKDNQLTTPGFDFAWNPNEKGIKGQALRKRVKLKPSTVQAPTTTIQVKSPESSPPKVVLNREFRGPQVNIKRKHKKDKQQAKFDNTESSSSVIKPTPKQYSLFGHKHKDIQINTRIGKSLSEKVFTSNKISDLPIHRHIISNLEKLQFKTLTTVQEKAIPIVLTGTDVLVRSQTGSGKTLAYTIPILEALQSIEPRLQRKDGVQAIIVVPTRELALQTHELFQKINTFQWIVSGHLCGGENRKSEKDRLRKGIHVLIGTPGRLLDHVLHTSALKINNVRCLVLDEADRLLDMGFRKDIISLVEELRKAKSHSDYDPMQILKQGTESESKPEYESKEAFPLKDLKNKNSQTLLLSATLNKGVTELAEFTMKDHIFVDALEDSQINKVQITEIESLVIPDTVTQEFLLTYPKHRLFNLSALVVEKSKKNAKMFVFMASTQMVDFHYELFSKYLLKMPVNRGKLKAGDVVLFDASSDPEDDDVEEEVVLDTKFFKLHGSMEQKLRKEVFNEFRGAKSGVLLCTDVAARGIDVPAADCIIQYTGPQTDEDYLHRVGRTGRAGQKGSAIIFLTHEEQDYVKRLNEQRVFLKQYPNDFLRCLCDVMEEPDTERAAEALQRRYESAVSSDKSLRRSACLAYSTWSRFYNSYPSKMRSIFNFKKLNLGHYATSFALRDTPSQISKIVRGEVTKNEAPRLNKKLANHSEAKSPPGPKGKPKAPQKRSMALITSEFESGLEPIKKKKKKKKE